MTAFEERTRIAIPVIVSADNRVLGRLPEITLTLPWLQEVTELVDLAKSLGAEIAVLRLLHVDESALPDMRVTYLCELTGGQPSRLLPFDGALDESDLRLGYARPGGPAAELNWAAAALANAGYGNVTQQTQIRTWNLSSIWCVKTDQATFWLKSIPPFFSHEGATLRLLADECVPQIVAADEHRVLLHHLPGEDCYAADVTQMLHMVERLVDLQWRWHDQIPTLLDTGLPDIRSAFLAGAVPALVNKYRDQLDAGEQAALDSFLDDLDQRLKELDECGVPDTLVHADYHPGNWRGSGLDLCILDWGDCAVGHPLLDLPALLDRAGEHAPQIAEHWQQCWQQKLPPANIARALALIAPVATVWKAITYDNFLQNIEPSEHPYHAADPLTFLRLTVETLQSRSPE